MQGSVRPGMVRFLIFILGVTAILLFSSSWLTSHHGVEYPRHSIISRDPTIDQAVLDTLATRQPATVLVGNSMVGEGIDEQLFASLVPGGAYKLGINGAASAVWYLFLKNVICALENPPRTVVLFFRDTFLTYPDYRVDGKYFSKVERFAGPDEELLDRLAYLDGMSSTTYFAEKWVPLFGEREKLQNEIVGVAKFGFPRRLIKADSSTVDQAINAVFADSNMNQMLLTAAQLDAEKVGGSEDHFDFEARVDVSFLPAMVGLMEERGVELVMCRIKRRRDLKPNSRPAALEAYIRDLGAYLDARGVPLLDYTEEDSLVLDHFGEGDHLNEHGREIFTRLVAEDLLALRGESGRDH